MLKKANLPTFQNILLFLMYLSPFVFPLYLARFKVAGIPVTVAEVFCYLFFAVFLLAVILGKQSISWKRPARWYYLTAFILLIGATLGVMTAPHFIALPSGVFMDSLQAAMGAWKGWVFAPALYFFTFTQVATDSAKLKKLLLYFVYSGALVAASSYLFGIFGNGITYDLRLSGFFESANYLSLYLEAPLLLGIYYLLHGNMLTRRQELYNVTSVTTMAHALFMTQSYAAIIAVFGAIALYILVLLVRRKMGFMKLTLIFLALIITFGTIAVTQLDSAKFRQFVDFQNRSSSTVRLEIYEVAWGLINTYPLTGVGPGLFQGFYQVKGPDILGKAPMEWNIPHPHNIFFAFWLNAGLLGLFSLLALLMLAHVRLTYPVIALWGIVIHGLFDTPFWKNDLAMIFWLVLGAILIMQTYGSSAPQKQTAPIRKRALPRRSSSARETKLIS